MNVHALNDGLRALASALQDTGDIKCRPAFAFEARKFIEGQSYVPSVGDIVTLREGMNADVKHPEMGQRVIVTQVFPTLRDDRSGLCSAAAADPKNIAIAMMFTHECDEPDCAGEQLVEFLHDSRIFMKVGHIDDRETDDDSLPF